MAITIMIDETSNPESNAPQAPEKRTPNKQTPQEVLEWTQSFHHETPPMFRRKFEEAVGPRESGKAAEKKLVDYDSDSEEESPTGKLQNKATVKSSVSRPLSIIGQAVRHPDIDRTYLRCF